MISIMRFLVIVLCMSLLGTVSAKGDVFTVADIAIDGSAKSVTAARANAMRDGTAQAANILIERMTLPADRAEAGFIELTPEIASQLVAGIQIQNEQRSSSRYIGDLTVVFDRRRVRDLLDSLQLPFVEAQTGNTLVLPVWDGPSGPVLWSENLWWNTWQAANPKHDLTPFILPLADLNDRNSLHVADTLRVNSDALIQMARRYEVSQIMVVEASADGPGRIMVRAKTISWDQEKNMQVSRQRIFADGSDAGAGRKALQAAYHLARHQIVTKAQNNWKQKAVVRSTSVSTLLLTASYRDQKGWRHIRKVLASTPTVKEARLDALSADGALMTIRYVGTRMQLRNQLNEGGILLLDTEIGPVARLR